MANVTIYEFQMRPDVNGYVARPAFVTTTIASTATHTLADTTRFIEVSTDTSGLRIGFNAAAVASGLPLCASDANRFLLVDGTSRTLQFL